MRQRKLVVGLLVLAALGLGLVPGAGTAGPEKAWACVAVWNPANYTCTATSTVTGGGLYHGAVRVKVNGVIKFYQSKSDCYHFSTVPLPPGEGCPELKGIGPGTVVVEALGPGSIAIVGSRGD